MVRPSAVGRPGRARRTPSPSTGAERGEAEADGEGVNANLRVFLEIEASRRGEGILCDLSVNPRERGRGSRATPERSSLSCRATPRSCVHRCERPSDRVIYGSELSRSARRVAGRNLVSLFSGVGGLDLGFRENGFSIRAAFDTDESARATYEHNLDHAVTERDATTLRPSDIGQPSVILAGPPCQGFTSIAADRTRAELNQLFAKAVDLIAAVRPKLFVVENVMGLWWRRRGSFISRAIRGLRAAGLVVSACVVDCSTFGVPQRRRRVLLVGGRSGAGVRFACSVEAMARARGAPAMLGSVLTPGCRESAIGNHLPSFAYPAWYSHVMHRIRPGQKLCDTRLGPKSVHSWDIPEVFGETSGWERSVLTWVARLRRHLRGLPRDVVRDGRPVRVSYLARSMAARTSRVSRAVESLARRGYVVQVSGGVVDLARRFNGRFRRLAEDELSPAVIREFLSPRCVIHPRSDRALTVRECARLQTFSDEFQFFGGIGRQYQLVANAFPPLVSRGLARAAARALDGASVTVLAG